MNSYNKLAKNSAIFAIGNFSSKFISLIMLPFYTSQLSQSDYGQIDVIITTIALLMPVFTVNIVEAIIRFSLDKKHYNYGEVLTNSIVIIIIGFISLITAYPLITKINFIEQYGYIFYSVFLLQAIHTSVKQFARAINYNKVFMASDIIFTFVFVAFNLLFILLLNLGVQGYLISLIIAYAIDLFFLIIKTNAIKYIKLKYIDKGKMKLMFVYCIPLIPNNIMWWVMNISDRYTIVYYLGLSANGLYAVASKLPSIIANFHTIFFNAWQVSAIEENESSNKNDFHSNIFNLFFFLMILFASLYMIFNKIVIDILVSVEFSSVWKYTPILVLAVVFSSFSAFIGTNYVAMKKTKGALYTSLIGATVNILLNFLLIPHFGLYGAAISTMVSFAIMWVIRVIDTRKFVSIAYPRLKMTLALTLIGIQLIISYLSISIIVKSLINCIIFVVIIFISLEYTKKPIVVLYSKYLRRKSI
ncbi:lipopolysaccharide biosynthesis protein [Paenibacillus sp. MCAF9]|uniref:lipopolysaccharide biosynthesis protein n=1 Tax=Paenibacillus sp. MCAF9 TaxID=3233046 RepID=UPI003F959FD3